MPIPAFEQAGVIVGRRLFIRFWLFGPSADERVSPHELIAGGRLTRLLVYPIAGAVSQRCIA